MTTIAWSRKTGTIAADTRSSYHGNPVPKLFKLVDGSILGTSGNYDDMLRVVAWMRSGEVAADKPTMPAKVGTLFRAYPDGRAVMYHECLEPVAISFDFFAVGSGSDYAMGALAQGATPVEAVLIASKFDEHTGGLIDSLAL